jgi:hypothetical protein
LSDSRFIPALVDAELVPSLCSAAAAGAEHIVHLALARPADSVPATAAASGDETSAIEVELGAACVRVLLSLSRADYGVRAMLGRDLRHQTLGDEPALLVPLAPCTCTVLPHDGALGLSTVLADLVHENTAVRHVAALLFSSVCYDVGIMLALPCAVSHMHRRQRGLRSFEHMRIGVIVPLLGFFRL